MIWGTGQNTGSRNKGKGRRREPTKRGGSCGIIIQKSDRDEKRWGKTSQLGKNSKGQQVRKERTIGRREGGRRDLTTPSMPRYQEGLSVRKGRVVQRVKRGKGQFREGGVFGAKVRGKKREGSIL